MTAPSEGVRPDLDAIQARADAATPGPWGTRQAVGDHDPRTRGDVAIVAGERVPGVTLGLLAEVFSERHRGYPDGATAMADADFIAAARSDIDALIAECRRLRAALEEIAADSPPDEWETDDHLNGYLGYGRRGKPGYVDEVDESNYDDVHDHGISVGRWLAAKQARRALSPAGAAPDGSTG